jgi:hypothetical protein
MSVTRVIDKEDQQMLDLLRELGLEKQLREYEALLRGELPFKVRSDPLPEPVPGVVSVADASARLRLPRKEVRRHVDCGLLHGEPDLATGELLVTNESIARLLDWQRRLAIIAQPLPGDVDEPLDPNSLLGRMFAEAAEPWEDDEEA